MCVVDPRRDVAEYLEIASAEGMDYTSPELSARVEVAVREAGELIRQHDRSPRRIRHKASIKDLVTETDCAVEAMIDKGFLASS